MRITVTSDVDSKSNNHEGFKSVTDISEQPILTIS